MQSLILNILGASLGLVGLVAFFGSLMPKWGGSGDETVTRIIATHMVLIGLGLYIASFFVG
jgi:hypothetical protein